MGSDNVVAIDAAAGQGIRALGFRGGTTVWSRRTGLPVRGARELANGVYVVAPFRRE